MAKGNPNPSPETRFKPGNPGGGKTSEQKRLEYEAAEMAAAARHKMLSVITEKFAQDEIDADAILEMIDANTLKLFKDSEDRAHGTPKQSIGGDTDNPLTMALQVTTKVVRPD